MSFLNRPTCGRGLRISSPPAPCSHRGDERGDTGRGPQLDGIRDLLFRQGDVGGAHVERDALPFRLRAEDLVVRDRDHLPALLVLEEVAHRTRHGPELDEEESGILGIAFRGRRDEQKPRFAAWSMETSAVASVSMRTL